GLPERELSEYDRCCICGPTPMMRAVADYVSGAIPTVEVSLEEMMGCGFGICYTCPVKRSDSELFYGACYDGPVFQYESIAL
ncbi:MAG: dihydroorotate dehydrogenase electron transfer subunit, partial [Planctomycetota bacterium]|nr:dihydroorotate dehydrogenase electron transfer subunit [Planctomycetota bacterium]